ncbi:MAG TPA: hypothetical protein VNL16_09520 [Chloroflexota bacterium]|nr:hypothetical protein [Chloroflexota bacterium]
MSEKPPTGPKLSPDLQLVVGVAGIVVGIGVLQSASANYVFGLPLAIGGLVLIVQGLIDYARRKP